MRRCDDGGTCTRRSLHTQLNLNALAIDRYRHRCYARLHQRLSGRHIAGIFRPYLVTCLEQGACNQLQRLTIAGRDEHLFRRARHTTRQLQIGGDFIAQRGDAGIRRISHVVLRSGAYRTCRQPRPELARKSIERR